jgi:hypothetical protein
VNVKVAYTFTAFTHGTNLFLALHLRNIFKKSEYQSRTVTGINITSHDENTSSGVMCMTLRVACKPIPIVRGKLGHLSSAMHQKKLRRTSDFLCRSGNHHDVDETLRPPTIEAKLSEIVLRQMTQKPPGWLAALSTYSPLIIIHGCWPGCMPWP